MLQIICIDSSGTMSLEEYEKALDFAVSKAVKLYPIVRKTLFAEMNS